MLEVSPLLVNRIMYHVKNIGLRVINPIPNLSYQDHAKIVISEFFWIRMVVLPSRVELEGK